MKQIKLLWLVGIGLTVGLFACKHCIVDDPICKLPKPDQGLCRGHFVVYYFDAKEGECKSTIYGGCGSVIPFWKKEDCEKCKCRD